MAESALERRDRLQAELDDLKQKYAETRDEEQRAGLLERMDNVKHGITAATERRRAELRQLLDDPNRVETPPAPKTSSAASDARRARDEALRAIERHAPRMRADASDRLDHLLREGDPLGHAARYVTAVGDPHTTRQSESSSWTRPTATCE